MVKIKSITKFLHLVATLYATLGIEALVHGINETEATHVITTSENLSKFDVSGSTKCYKK